MDLRSQRGELGVAGWLAVAVVVVLLAGAPYIFLFRQEQQGAEAAIGAIGQADDAQAKVELTNAIRGAQVHFAEVGSMEGYGPEEAARFDPSITYDAAPSASAGRVSIRGVGPSAAVFVTLGGAGPLCVAMNADVISYGHVDAQTPAECADPTW